MDQSEGAGLITRKTPGAIGPAHRCQPHSIMPCLAFERETHTRTDPFDPGEGLQTPVLLVARSTTGLGVKARNKNPYWVSCCPPPRLPGAFIPLQMRKEVCSRSLWRLSQMACCVYRSQQHTCHIFFISKRKYASKMIYTQLNYLSNSKQLTKAKGVVSTIYIRLRLKNDK